MIKSKNKQGFVKWISIILVAIIVILAAVSGCLHFFCMPLRNGTKHNQVRNCFSYLIELFGRGSQIEMNKTIYKGFGIYVEEYYLTKSEIVSLEIDGNDSDILSRYSSPVNVTEFIQLEYFLNNVFVKQKKYITEKQGKATLQFKQTGVKGLFTTNELFLNKKSSISILTESTDCLNVDEFDGGSVLFACKKNISLEETISYMEIWNNLQDIPVLLTDSLAIKTGENNDSPVIFLKTATRNSQPIKDSAKGYYNKITAMLQYLVDNYDVTQMILGTGIFGNSVIDVKNIYEYILTNGLIVIGYNAVDTKFCSNSIYDAVIQREQDAISKLVQVNNGINIFKN